MNKVFLLIACLVISSVAFSQEEKEHLVKGHKDESNEHSSQKNVLQM